MGGGGLAVGMNLNDAIKNRKSVKKFKSIKPDWRDVIECIDSMRHAPTAGGISTIKIILVSDAKKIQKIADAAQQDFIAQANFVVVVCSDSSKTISSYGERGKKYARQQAGAAIQNFLLKIEDKKLSTCWIGHFVDEQIKKILEIPENIDVEAVFPVGYEFRKEKISAKVELDRILYFEKYGNKKMKNPKRIDS